MQIDNSIAKVCFWGSGMVFSFGGPEWCFLFDFATLLYSDSCDLSAAISKHEPWRRTSLSDRVGMLVESDASIQKKCNIKKDCKNKLTSWCIKGWSRWKQSLQNKPQTIPKPRAGTDRKKNTSEKNTIVD